MAVFSCVMIQFVQPSLHSWTFKVFPFFCCCHSAAVNILSVCTRTKAGHTGIHRDVELLAHSVCTPSALLDTMKYFLSMNKAFMSVNAKPLCQWTPASEMCKKWYSVLTCIPWSLNEAEHLSTFVRCVGLSCELLFLSFAIFSLVPWSFS